MIDAFADQTPVDFEKEIVGRTRREIIDFKRSYPSPQQRVDNATTQMLAAQKGVREAEAAAVAAMQRVMIRRKDAAVKELKLSASWLEMAAAADE
jgi:hypothetical protein